ncbi:MAG: zf-HC2 domain-containing protein [Thermodesulfobacteriota bacterium]
MKCEKCSELLIDYIHNDLSPELKDMVRVHISGCSKCSKEFKEYEEIRMAAQAEALPEVSSEVLTKLSKAASDDIKKARTPFWKKWSYSPILVPTLTTAIALSVWFYYGDEAVNLSSLEQEKIALKTQADAVSSESENGDSFADENVETGSAFVVAQESDPIPPEVKSKPLEQPLPLEYEQVPASPTEPKISSGSEFEEDTKEFDEVELYESQDLELQVQRKVKSSPEQPMSSNNLKQQELGLAKSSMQREQDGAPSQKKIEDDCEASIRTNEAIINSSDPVSEPVQKKSYKTLAQCYEQKGDYDKAISNYISLEQVAPEESSFANSRIQEIRNRIRIEQGHQKQLSAPQPAN